jgi:hypothetical protein
MFRRLLPLSNLLLFVFPQGIGQIDRSFEYDLPVIIV